MSEFDYYGGKLTTIEPERCSNTMEKIVYPVTKDKEYYRLFSESSPHSQLSEDDKAILVDYAPKLFNVYSNPSNVERAMFVLAKLVWNYRLYQSPNFAPNYIGDHNFKRFEKDPKKKIESFKNKIDDLIELMGGNFSKGYAIDNPNMPLPHELKEMLKYAKSHPREYLPDKPKVSADKEKIRKYLVRLKLKGKSDFITDFIKALD